MANIFDLTIGGDPERAKSTVIEAVQGAGFVVEAVENGLTAKKGSKVTTSLLGAFTPKASHYANLEISFFTGAQGEFIVRFQQHMTGTAMMSGAIGASRARNAYIDIINDIQGRLSTAGVLLSTVEL